jgi:altronate hydrolase
MKVRAHTDCIQAASVSSCKALVQDRPELFKHDRGFRRPSGRVGTRNFIAVLTSVNCSATAARMIADHFTPEVLAAYPNVDGVAAFTTAPAAAWRARATGFEALQRVMWGYARNPNVAAC